MTDKPATSVYFRGLNELRAIAALTVLVYHVELKEHRLGNLSLFDTGWKLVWRMGAAGVWLFFVLSGFLITYLLLAEYGASGTVRVRDFYVRRSLRIWPLYYMIVLISFFVIPAWCSDLPGSDQYHERIAALDHNFGRRLVLFACMLPNLALAKFSAVVGAAQTWSIGSEEQFYLLWPWVIYLFRRRLPWAILTVIGLKLALAAVVNGALDTAGGLVLGRYLRMLYLEVMGLGALAAWLLFEHRPRIEPWLTHRGVQVGVLLGGGFLVCWFPEQPLLWGVLFAYLVLSVTVEGGIPLRSRWLDSMGRYSYGIYMFHSTIMLLAVAWLSSWQPASGPLRHVLFYFLVVPSTLVVSWLSYHLLESPFLRLKARFSVVASGDDVADSGETRPTRRTIPKRLSAAPVKTTAVG